MRILFSSTSGYGHVFPMLPLARACVAAGHDVLWALASESRPLLDGTGIDTAAAGLSGAALLEARHAVLSQAEEVAPADRAAFVFPRMFGAAFTPAMVEDLLPLAMRWGPDVLVHENGELAAPVVGAVLGVPSVCHAFGGAIPPAYLTEAGGLVEELWTAQGEDLPPYAGCFRSLYLDICPPAVQTVPSEHIGAIHGLRPVADTGLEPETVPGYLEDDGRPLVYLTLGTVRNQSPVLGPALDAIAALPVRVLVTVGPDGDPAALGTQPSNVHVERWVHQPQVLEHCSVVASHAGSGTFLGALGLGLPQLCLPQAADQFRNAAGGGRSGAALVLAPHDATADAIAAAVTRLLAEDRFRRNAVVVAAEIADMPSPADVVDELVRRFGPA